MKPCFFPAKPLTFRSRLHGLFSPGFIVVPISPRKLPPLVSALAVRFRDVIHLYSVLTMIWMYATPVIYPMGMIKGDHLRFVMQLNPLTGIFEAFKYGLLGAGTFSWCMLAYSACFTVVLVMLGVVVFNRVQKSFIDTV